MYVKNMNPVCSHSLHGVTGEKHESKCVDEDKVGSHIWEFWLVDREDGWNAFPAGDPCKIQCRVNGGTLG